MEGHPLRLDKFLYYVRLAKSRSKAQRLIAEGHPRIDHRPALSVHTEIRPGNRLTIVIGARVRVFAIRELPLRRGPATEIDRYLSDLSPAETIDADAE